MLYGKPEVGDIVRLNNGTDPIVVTKGHRGGGVSLSGLYYVQGHYRDRPSFYVEHLQERFTLYGDTENIEVGGTVRLKTSKSPIIVTSVIGFPRRVYGYYKCPVPNPVNESAVDRWETDLVLVSKKCNIEQPQKESQEMTNTLYQFTKDGDDTKQFFGSKLAVNSAGMWVMEEKGTGLISAVTKDKVLEVMPNTISVVFKEDGQVYSYFAEAGKFKVGSFYLGSSQLENGSFCIAKVIAVDTKSKSATKDFNPIAELSTLAV